MDKTLAILPEKKYSKQRSNLHRQVKRKGFIDMAKYQADAEKLLHDIGISAEKKILLQLVIVQLVCVLS